MSNTNNTTPNAIGTTYQIDFSNYDCLPLEIKECVRSLPLDVNSEQVLDAWHEWDGTTAEFNAWLVDRVNIVYRGLPH